MTGTDKLPNNDTAPTKPGDETPPGTEQSAEGICPKCGGSGAINGMACSDCAGSGTVTVIVGDA